jgi:glycosyltransferase involved in cell wall biosynthesis
MNICLVTNRIVKGEGQGRVNYEIVRRAAAAGHRVTCLAHAVSPDLHVHPRVSWAFMPDAQWPVALVGNLRFAWRSTRWLRAHGDAFDLTVGNGCITWFPVDLNVVHFVHGAWLQSPLGDKGGRGLYGVYQWLYARLNARLEKHLLPRAGVVVAVSEQVGRDLAAQGLPPGSVRVIPNGVDLDEFHPGPEDRRALGLPTEVPLAAFAGDLRTPRKNLDTVLRALAEVPALHLAVAGAADGSPFPALAEALGVNARVHFLGFRDDVPALMRAADLFVFPSRYEACALVLLEAMASGLPVVTARTTGGAELVCDDCGVVLDDPDDAERLAGALRRLVGSPARRRAMGQQARAQARTLSWATMAERYLSLMHDVAEPSRSS